MRRYQFIVFVEEPEYVFWKDNVSGKIVARIAAVELAALIRGD